jgi:hypothetical protein
MEISNEQLMKFKITKDKLKMEISLLNINFLFENDPSQDPDNLVTIKRGKLQKFTEQLVIFLIDPPDSESNDVNWGLPFTAFFQEVLEGLGVSEDLCNYPDLEDENE